MKIKVNKEEKFISRSSKMSIAATTSGYTLNYSVDGSDWDAFSSAVPAEENLILDVAQGIWFKMVGNTDDNVIVRF